MPATTSSRMCARNANGRPRCDAPLPPRDEGEQGTRCPTTRAASPGRRHPHTLPVHGLRAHLRPAARWDSPRMSADDNRSYPDHRRGTCQFRGSQHRRGRPDRSACPCPVRLGVCLTARQFQSPDPVTCESTPNSLIKTGRPRGSFRRLRCPSVAPLPYLAPGLPALLTTRDYRLAGRLVWA